MKIVFLARYLPQEGSTTHMYTLARGLINRGHEVHIISSGPTDDAGAIRIFNEITEAGLHHHSVGFPKKRNSSNIGKLKQFVQYMIALPKAIKILYSISPDIIHVHYPVTSFIASAYRIFKGKKYVVTHHISDIPMHPLNRKGDCVIAISRELQRELIDRYLYKEEQVKLIFNGVSNEKFAIDNSKSSNELTKVQIGLPDDKVIIGFLGSLNYRKGIDILIKSLSGIDKNTYHLCLVGDGDLEWVKKLIEKYDIINNVSIFPFQDPVIFYQSFDIFVLASRKEGFPLVPLEAMMMGVPTIRSHVEGASDQIIHDETGYLFESENEKQLHDFLLKLIYDKQLRIEMGLKAKEYVTENFTEEKMLDKLIDVYNSLITD